MLPSRKVNSETVFYKSFQFNVPMDISYPESQGWSVTFFCDKDYHTDLARMANSDEIMKAIQRIRDPIRSLDETNKKVVFKFISNLCTLSNIYSTL